MYIGEESLGALVGRELEYGGGAYVSEGAEERLREVARLLTGEAPEHVDAEELDEGLRRAMERACAVVTRVSMHRRRQGRGSEVRKEAELLRCDVPGVGRFYVARYRLSDELGWWVTIKATRNRGEARRVFESMMEDVVGMQ